MLSESQCFVYECQTRVALHSMDVTPEQYVIMVFFYAVILTVTAIFSFRKRAIAAGYDTQEKQYGAKKTRKLLQKYLKSQ